MVGLCLESGFQQAGCARVIAPGQGKPGFQLCELVMLTGTRHATDIRQSARLVQPGLGALKVAEGQ